MAQKYLLVILDFWRTTFTCFFTAGGIRVGEGDRLAGAGRAGGGRRTALGGLVVGGGPSPGVGRDGAVGAGGQEVVPAAEEEEVAAF